MRKLDKILLKSPEKGWDIRFCYFFILPFVPIISCNYRINLPGKYFEYLYWMFIFFISINFKYYFKKFNDNITRQVLSLSPITFVSEVFLQETE
ncbi:hypothetical protein J2Y40_004669 [Chryseobacterium sp. 2987]|nr:hypothetical protein [Chryseobacterium sp. 2987]